MNDEMERRLREAFDAKASQVTPEMIDVEREHEFTQETRGGSGRRRRGLALAGVGTAAAAAAAVAIGAVVTTHQDTPRPALAATESQTTTAASTHAPPPPAISSESGLTADTAQVPPTQPRRTTTVAPPPSAPTSTPVPPPARTTAAETAPPPISTPSSTASSASSAPATTTSPPAGSTGDYALHGSLRQAAGVDVLPLPKGVTWSIVDQTGRTTRLHTGDCAAVRGYWKTAMPQHGWKRAPAAAPDRWFAPTGNAWAFTDAGTGSCTIQISAGP